uniref:Innexin n=1 Tax=Cryptocotyle lingua TaxID=66766 RepID=A0A7U0TI90_9TREM|nr:innexin 10 [Cryptocotyle lingua]
MVALEFISQLEKLRFVDSVGLDDFADRCSYMLSFVLLVLCFTIVTLKSYVFEPLSCYVPTTFSGSNLGPYINAFCWVNGTTPISAETDRLDDQNYWNSLEDKKLNYYQWVSLVLALQAILCYVPRLVWETITFNRVGTNLGFLIESAQAASKETGKEREQRVQFIANVMDTLLFARRDLRKTDGRPAVHSTLSTLAHGLRDLLPRKRLGTALASYYMLVKFMYLFNAVGQLLLMQRFLGARGRYQLFGLSILSDLLSGRHWNETSVFPRVGFCRVPIKLTSTPIPMVTVQCTLPVNMLNEKIYVFLWFWFVFVASLEVVSVFVWIYRLAARQSRLRLLVRYLKIADAYDEGMDPLLTRFEMTFLRLDGSFLLQMMRLNAGSLITQEILQAMLKRYTQQEEYALAQQRKKAKPHYIPSDHVDQDKAGLLCAPESPDCTVTKRADPI